MVEPGHRCTPQSLAPAPLVQWRCSKPHTHTHGGWGVTALEASTSAHLGSELCITGQALPQGHQSMLNQLIH